MKPYPVTPAAYFNDYVGINVGPSTPDQSSRPEQSSGKLKSEVEGKQLASRLTAIDYLEKIYDVVVGFNHDDATSFSRDPALNQSKRFGTDEIAQVIQHATEIMRRTSP